MIREYSRERIDKVIISQTFLRFWIPESFYMFASVTTTFVLAVIAVVVLHATAIQAGLLVVFQELPVFLLSLFVGVWLDRRDLRLVLIFVSLVQTLLLIFALFLLNLHSSIYLLYGFAAALGVAKLVLDLCYTSLLPELIKRHHLVAGNARLQVTTAGIKILAPALAGLLAKYFFPPLILLICILASVASTVALFFIPQRELSRSSDSTSSSVTNFVQEMKEGVGILFHDELLRPLVTSSCMSAFAMGIYQALLVIAVTRNLMLDTSSLGILLALGSVATLAAASMVPGITRVTGMGRTLVIGNLFTTLGMLLIAGSTQLISVSMAAAGLLSIGLGSPLFSVNQISIRQAVTPVELMSRVNASRRFIVFSFLPIGALAGGLLGEILSIAAGLYCAAVAMLIATVILVRSSLRNRYLHFEQPVARVPS